MEGYAHFLALINITFAVPSKVALPEVPNHEFPHSQMPIPRVLLHSFLKFPCILAHFKIADSTRFKKSPYGDRCLYSEHFLTYLPVSPVKALHSPQSSLQATLSERDDPNLESNLSTPYALKKVTQELKIHTGIIICGQTQKNEENYRLHIDAYLLKYMHVKRLNWA